MKCAECRWWRQRDFGATDSFPWAVCLMADRQLGSVQDRQFYVRDGYMVTRSDFGCILFEQKEADK